MGFAGKHVVFVFKLLWVPVFKTITYFGSPESTSWRKVFQLTVARGQHLRTRCCQTVDHSGPSFADFWKRQLVPWKRAMTTNEHVVWLTCTGILLMLNLTSFDNLS